MSEQAAQDVGHFTPDRVLPVDVTRGPLRWQYLIRLLVILLVIVTVPYDFCFVTLRLHVHASPHRFHGNNGATAGQGSSMRRRGQKVIISARANPMPLARTNQPRLAVRPESSSYSASVMSQSCAIRIKASRNTCACTIAIRP